MSGMVGTAPSTTTLTMPDGSTIALADWIDDKLYGSAQLTNGQTNPLEAFSTGRSQPIPGGVRVQTSVDTNIPRNGDTGLPKDWEMLVYAFGFMVTRVMNAGPNNYPILPDGVPADIFVTYTESQLPSINTLFQIDRVTMLLYEYNAKIYTKGILQDFTTGHGYKTFTTNTVTENAQNGVQSPRDRVALVLPVHERENLSFKGIIQPEAPLNWSQVSMSGNGPLDYADTKWFKYGLIKRTVV